MGRDHFKRLSVAVKKGTILAAIVRFARALLRRP